MRLFALRGAISVKRNDAQDVLDATTELMQVIMERNALAPDHVVSCIFTATNDLNAEFPAVAARALGFDRVPLLCAREIPVPGSLPRVIRVLIHYHADEDHNSRHVYLGDAAELRADLQSAQ
jgi:chorismate mutase